MDAPDGWPNELTRFMNGRSSRRDRVRTVSDAQIGRYVTLLSNTAVVDDAIWLPLLEAEASARQLSVTRRH